MQYILPYLTYELRAGNFQAQFRNKELDRKFGPLMTMYSILMIT